jgi:DNA-binding transcriptional MerR regulator
MTREQIEQIEENYGMTIEKIQETYGFSLAEIAESMKRQVAENERLAQDEAFRLERQKQLEAESKARRKEAEASFKAIVQNDFFESNLIADESDFERIYPTIRDEFLLENYRKFTAQKAEKVAKAYKN